MSEGVLLIYSKLKRMKKLIAILVLLVTMSINSFSQIGWVPQQSGTTASILSLSFVNNMTGWYCGSGGVIGKTSNGGLNWVTQVSGTTENLYAINFVDGNTGWAAGGHLNPNLNGHIMIVKTTNGGANWFIQFNGGSDYNYPISLNFLDANTGFAACDGYEPNVLKGCIMRTTNGGTDWLIMQGTKNAKKVFFTNINTGYYISKVLEDYNNIDSGVVYKTTNAGLNWSVSFTKYHHSLFNIMFFNQNTGIIQGRIDSSNNNRYYKTTDAGNSWNLISTGNTIHNTSFFNNETTGWALGTQIYRTTNGGVNWDITLPNPFSYFICITFSDLLKGWAAGSNGVLYSSVLTGINQIGSEIPTSYSLSQNYPNPFNPITKIKFSVVSSPPGLGGDLVLLKVYDITGREVQTLVNERLQAGIYEATFDGSMLNSGVYFYQLLSGTFK
jgi:photosystem II stability/assembly factor-like uncharacterized protein